MSNLQLQIHSAFFPNVSGYAGGILNAASGTQQGALSMARERHHVGQELGNETGYTALNLNSSLSNSIYGNNTKVQPRAFQALIIIKA